MGVEEEGGGGRGEIGGRGGRCREGGENEAAEAVEEEEEEEEGSHCVDYYYCRKFNYSQSTTQEILNSVLKFFLL